MESTLQFYGRTTGVAEAWCTGGVKSMVAQAELLQAGVGTAGRMVAITPGDRAIATARALCVSGGWWYATQSSGYGAAADPPACIPADDDQSGYVWVHCMVIPPWIPGA